MYYPNTVVKIQRKLLSTAKPDPARLYHQGAEIKKKKTVFTIQTGETAPLVYWISQTFAIIVICTCDYYYSTPGSRFAIAKNNWPLSL